MRAAPERPPWWTRLSAGLAPVALIGGWTWAASVQPAGFSSRRDTISALAAHGAQDRWIMTGGLALLGCCHLVTAVGLRPASPAGRVVLAVGGVATTAVAVFPQPAGGSSAAHTAAAATGFVLLSLWPLAGARRNSAVTLMRPRAAALAAAALLAAVGWFAVDLAGSGPDLGVAERVAAGAQSGWPLAVVTTWWLTTRRDRDGTVTSQKPVRHIAPAS